jgi:hypothetical protein
MHGFLRQEGSGRIEGGHLHPAIVGDNNLMSDTICCMSRCCPNAWAGMTSSELPCGVRCRRILLGRAKFLLHIAKGKKGRAAVLRLSEAKSGA